MLVDMDRLTATEASRAFSALLSRAAAGESMEIVRSGQPVAVIGPPRPRGVSTARLVEILRAAPPVDADFADELRAARAALGTVEDHWSS